MARCVLTAAATLAILLLPPSAAAARLIMPSKSEPATVSCGPGDRAINPRFVSPTIRPLSETERAEIDGLIEGLENIDEGSISGGLAAEISLRRIIAMMELSYGPRHPLTGFAYGELGAVLIGQRRGREGSDSYVRARDILWESLGDAHCDTIATSRALMWSLKEQHRFAEAVNVTERQIAAQERKWGKESQEHQLQWNRDELSNILDIIEPKRVQQRQVALTIASASDALPAQIVTISKAESLMKEGQSTEAVNILSNAWQKIRSAGGDDPYLETILNYYRNALSMQGRVAEPEVYERLIAASGNPEAPPEEWTKWSTEATLWSDYGRALLATGQAQKGLQVLRRSCGSLSQLGYDDAAIPLLYAGADPRASGECRTQLARAMWAVARNEQASNRERLLAEAFQAVQPGLVSDATRALGRKAAVDLARASGKGTVFERVERLSRDIAATELALEEALDDAGFAKVSSPEDAQKREVLEQRSRSLRAERGNEARSLIEDIRQLQGFLAPEPLPIAELQSSHSNVLLKSGEVLLLPIIGERPERGLVFAITRERAVWAELGMTGEEIAGSVKALRASLDPCQPGQPNCSREIGQAFDFVAAHRLYQALFGDEAIAALLRKAETVILVPTGALTSLPPSVLLTRPYVPDPSSNEAAQFRAAPWFIKSHAISVLPGVAELKTIRSARGRVQGLEHFVALAEPDYSGTGRTPRQVFSAQSTISRTGLSQAGVIDQRSLIASLPPLPGTRIEAERLQSMFTPSRSTVRLYDAASERTLRALSDSGALASADVVLFATHGIVRGDNGLREAALALSPAFPGVGEDDDGLLTGAEISRLHLDANLLILSACNTALSPEDWSGVSYSELVRAFFQAGARSIVASHWRVDDGTTPALLGAMLQASRGSRPMGLAAALQRASLLTLMGESSPFLGLDPAEADAIAQRQAQPAFWGPFTLIGVPD